MPSGPSFQRRAARLLAANPPPPLESLDAVITDGCAEALVLETELRRVARRREAALERMDEPGVARSTVDLGELQADLEARLDELHDAIGSLMRRRARQRLATFVASR